MKLEMQSILEDEDLSSYLDRSQHVFDALTSIDGKEVCLIHMCHVFVVNIGCIWLALTFLFNKDSKVNPFKAQNAPKAWK